MRHESRLGLHDIAATPAKHRALFFSFYETPPRLLAKARRLNLGLEKRIQSGEIEVVWQPSTERMSKKRKALLKNADADFIGYAFVRDDRDAGRA